MTNLTEQNTALRQANLSNPADGTDSAERWAVYRLEEVDG